jgi:hypothetical protein
MAAADKLQLASDPSKAINISTGREPSQEQARYHISSSLSRRGSLWPQTFGSQMDNKIFPSSPRSRRCSGNFDERYSGSFNRNSDSIKDAVAQCRADSDLTEPLLGREKTEGALSPEKYDTIEGDLEANRRVDGALSNTRSSESSPLRGTGGDQGSFGDLDKKEDAVPAGSSFLQATLNGVNVLAGIICA